MAGGDPYLIASQACHLVHYTDSQPAVERRDGVKCIEGWSKLGVIGQVLQTLCWAARPVFREGSEASPPTMLEVRVRFVPELSLISTNLVVDFPVFWFSLACVGLDQILFRLNTDS